MGKRDFMREYIDLIRQVDAVARNLEALHRQHLRCQAGCCSCCTLSSVLPLEAAVLRQAVEGLAGGVRRRLGSNSGKSSCPFLLDALCVIYQSRPLICRTHGLPIAYVDYERQAIEVSACPLNFSEHYEFSQQEMLFIDTMNAELAQLNSEYCGGRGIADEVRVELVDII